MTAEPERTASIDSLIKALGGSTDEKEQAIKALRTVGEPAIPALASAAYGQYESTACAAAEALAAIGGTQAEAALRDGLQALFQAVGQAVMPALMQGSWNAVNIRIPNRMGAFARALGDLESAVAVDVLLQCLEFTRHLDSRPNGFSDTTAWIIGALGDIGSPKAVDALVKLLGDKLFGGRAIDALGKIGDPRAVAPLLKAVGWPHGHSIGVALKAMGAVDKVDELILKLSDTGGQGLAAADALKGLTDQDFGADEKRWSAWWKTQKPASQKSALPKRKVDS
jgi:HEAT repeat protein